MRPAAPATLPTCQPLASQPTHLLCSVTAHCQHHRSCRARLQKRRKSKLKRSQSSHSDPTWLGSDSALEPAAFATGAAAAAGGSEPKRACTAVEGGGRSSSSHKLCGQDEADTIDMQLDCQRAADPQLLQLDHPWLQRQEVGSPQPQQQQQLQTAMSWSAGQRGSGSSGPHAAEATAATTGNNDAHSDGARSASARTAVVVAEAEAAGLQAALEEALAVPVCDTDAAPVPDYNMQVLFHAVSSPSVAAAAVGDPAQQGVPGHTMLQRTSTCLSSAAGGSVAAAGLAAEQQAAGFGVASPAMSALAGGGGGVAAAALSRQVSFAPAADAAAADQLATEAVVTSAQLAALQLQCQQLQERLARQASGTLSGLSLSAATPVGAPSMVHQHAASSSIAGSACLQQPLAAPQALKHEPAAVGLLSAQQQLHRQLSATPSSPTSTATAVAAVNAAMHFELAELVASQFEAANAVAEADQLEALLERELLAAAALPPEQAQNSWARRLDSTINSLSRSISTSCFGPAGPVSSDMTRPYAAAAAAAPAPSAPAALMASMRYGSLNSHLGLPAHYAAGGGSNGLRLGPNQQQPAAAGHTPAHQQQQHLVQDAAAAVHAAQQHLRGPGGAGGGPAASAPVAGVRGGGPAFDDRLATLQQQLMHLQGMISGLRAEMAPTT